MKELFELESVFLTMATLRHKQGAKALEDEGRKALDLSTRLYGEGRAYADAAAAVRAKINGLADAEARTAV